MRIVRWQGKVKSFIKGDFIMENIVERNRVIESIKSGIQEISSFKKDKNKNKFLSLKEAKNMWDSWLAEDDE